MSHGNHAPSSVVWLILFRSVEALLLDPMGALFPHESPGISPYVKLSELNAIEWNKAAVSKYFQGTRWSAIDIVTDLDKATGIEGWNR